MPAIDPDATRERETNPRRTIALVVLVRDGREILLVRTKRLPHDWQPIGGGVLASDPSVVHAAIRETKEETGLVLRPEDVRPIIETPYDFGQGTIFFSVAHLPAGVELAFDASEIVGHGWFTIEEALALPMYSATATCVRFLGHHHEAWSRR